MTIISKIETSHESSERHHVHLLLQWNYENREQLKYIWNVYCFLSNHMRDLQTAKVLKWFPLVKETRNNFRSHFVWR